MNITKGSFDPLKLLFVGLAIYFALAHSYTAAIIFTVVAATCGAKLTWRRR